MRRIVLLVVVALVIAAMMVASALPALARSCVGTNVSNQHAPGNQGPGFGQAISRQAQRVQPMGPVLVVPAAQEKCD
jgi:hypothetical protein